MGWRECAAEVEAQKKRGFFLIGESDTGLEKRRHWNKVLEDSHKRSFQVEEKQK